MVHRALVIGLDEYVQQKSLRLQGAVGDAISMAKWLVDHAGGAVPPSNVTLLTSPALTPPPPELSGVVFVGSATSQTINQQLVDIPRKAADSTDRLYLYFAGHGLTALMDIAQEAILPADFTTPLTRSFIGHLVGNICRDNVLKERNNVQYKESR